MAWSDPVLGGGNALIREEIKSPNFVAGVSGWDLDKDGDAEFNNVVVRGTIEADGANGSYVKLVPDTPHPRIEFRGQSTAQVATIENDAGSLDLSSTGPAISMIRLNGPNAAILPGAIMLDTTNSPTGQIYLSSLNGIQAGSDITYQPNSTTVPHGQVFSRNISFAVTASNTQVITYPIAYPVGVVPTGIFCNINATSGTAAKWICHGTNFTNTGFTLWSRSGDGTTSAWTNIPVVFMVVD